MGKTKALERPVLALRPTCISLGVRMVRLEPQRPRCDLSRPAAKLNNHCPLPRAPRVHSKDVERKALWDCLPPDRSELPWRADDLCANP